MNCKSYKNLFSWGTLTSLVLAQFLVGLAPIPARSETTARFDGRSKLNSGNNQTFDGHCIIKQKQRDNTTVVVLQIDNSTNYRFYGPNKQALQVETFDGIHNVQYQENGGKELFSWDEFGDRQRLAIVLDAQKPNDMSHNDPAPQQNDLGAIIGAGVGALIGGLISGGGSNQTPSNNATASFRCSSG